MTPELDKAFDEEYAKYKALFPKEYDGKALQRMQDRNETLEEVAQEFDKMTALGDTSASFARFVRDMKKWVVLLNNNWR